MIVELTQDEILCALVAKAREKVNAPNSHGGRIQLLGEAYEIEDYLTSLAITESCLIAKRCLVDLS